MKRKVLLIEDSVLTRMEVGDLLREHFRAEVVEAVNGLEGLEKLGSEPDLNLIVADIEMPGMDGVEFIRNVRSMDDFCFLPIVVMSSLGRIKRRDDALNSGADAFIPKPVTVEALETILEDVW